MDTADKLVYIINKENPKIIDLSRKSEGILFSFEETGFLFLRSECETGSRISVECNGYFLPDKGKTETDGLFEIENHVDYQFSGGDLYYLPGQYRILYCTSKGTKEFFFTVRRKKELTEDGYNNIIQRIENLLHGLVFDLKRKGNSQSVTESLFALQDTLEKNYISFRNELSYLLLHLDSDLKNSYVRSDSIGKMDYKSVRMNLTHPSYRNKPISKKKDVTYDIIENQNIKKEIQDMKNQLLLILISIKVKRNAILIETSVEEETSNSKKMVKEKMRQDKTEADSFLKKTEEICQKYFSLCGQFLNHPIMRQVKDIPMRKGYSRREAELKKRIDELLDSSKTAYQYKSSQQVFEYYGFYFIHSALMESGYHLLSELDFTSFRENDTCIYYESEDKVATVYYGPYCENYLKTLGKDITVSVNSKHKSPDFILRLYDRKSGNFLFENVLEVKYIPFWKVQAVKEKQEDIIDTASDYLQFGYLSENRELFLGVIHKVFVLFVSKTEQIVDKYDLHRIYFLGVNGTDCKKVESFLKENLLN